MNMLAVRRWFRGTDGVKSYLNMADTLSDKIWDYGTIHDLDTGTYPVKYYDIGEEKLPELFFTFYHNPKFLLGGFPCAR